MIKRLIVSYVALVAVALAAFTVPVAFTLTAQLRGDTEESVRREATTMALLLGDGDEPARQALARMAGAYADETPGTVEVVAADGRSAMPPLPLPGDPGDAAFGEALGRGRTTVDWGSRRVWGPQLVVTVPVYARGGPAGRGERIVGAVRVRYETADLTDRLWRIWGFRAVLAVGVLAVAAGLGAIVARLLTKPLRQLNDMASRFGDGDLTARSPVTGPQETQTLARALNQGAERLDTLVASQRIFVADASHQLRTPLTALRLSLDNIADGVDDEFVREDVDQATAEVVRMSRLVSGLLVLARAEAKVSAPEPLALRELVEERLSVWRPAADERGVTIVLTGDADARLRVLAGPGNLDQVLDNVLSNALEVSPDQGTITVRVDSGGGHDEAVLEVVDEGPGMSAAEQARAFDRFWRGQGLTGRSGSGLGLAIVKQLVTDDGGGVALRDAPGGGLCVRIGLRPAAEGPPRWISPRPAAPRSGG
ncbi:MULTISPECIES: HAMP domain-containing sensor histidine kinase [unclassified Streptomyces]|uniref:sensor histidine kinase n=1 Tax=unclassified Streptomyces TaxID=2593676 RepID=UPI0006F26FFC|nr:MULTISPECIES: HAMP domain-containing sensor histidine kinase [unclassified Streptomyces]KQX56276.1 histidine kinase [Streptomyces sp. Root1304]KRA97091.1 histidine kinase [Streptomyces sp. Root66D1]